jgi:tetratricopeptide (TPR) repeat protein
MKALRNQFQLRWLLLEDRELDVHRQYKVIAVPTVVIVTPDRRIATRLAGYTLAFGTRFRQSLRASLDLPPLADAADATTATRNARRYKSTGDIMVRRAIHSVALRNYEKALELDPELHEARLALAFCLLRTGKVEPARQQFAQLKIAEAFTTQTQVGLAWARALDGESQQARKELERLRKVASEAPVYYEAWAAIYKADGNDEKAREAQQKVLDLRGKRVQAPVTRPNPEKLKKK